MSDKIIWLEIGKKYEVRRSWTDKVSIWCVEPIEIIEVEENDPFCVKCEITKSFRDRNEIVKTVELYTRSGRYHPHKIHDLDIVEESGKKIFSVREVTWYRPKIIWKKGAFSPELGSSVFFCDKDSVEKALPDVKVLEWEELKTFNDWEAIIPCK